MLTIALALALNSSAVVRDDPFVDLMQSRLPADYVGCNAEYTKWYSTWKARANELTIAKKGEYETTQEFDARKAALRKRLYDVPFPPPGKSKYFAYQVEVETTYNADRGEIKFHAFIDDGVRFSVQGDPAAYIGFISTSLAFKQPDLFRYEGRGTKGPGDRYHFEGTVPCERERAPELRANMRALVACTVDPIDRWSVFPPRSTYLFPYVELFPAFQMIGAILYSEKTGEVLVRKTNFAAAKAEICLRHLRVLSFGVNAHTKATKVVSQGWWKCGACFHNMIAPCLLRRLDLVPPSV